MAQKQLRRPSHPIAVFHLPCTSPLPPPPPRRCTVAGASCDVTPGDGALRAVGGRRTAVDNRRVESLGPVAGGVGLPGAMSVEGEDEEPGISDEVDRSGKYGEFGPGCRTAPRRDGGAGCID